MESQSSLGPLFGRPASENISKRFVIVVPNVIPPPPKDWCCEHQEPWLDLFIQQYPDSRRPSVLFFRHQLGPKNDAFWSELLAKGQDLLLHVEKLIDEHQLPEKSVMFVCHSLGGIIVKQAMCSAFNRPGQKLVHAVAGIIFLSTPHLDESNEKDMETLLGIVFSHVRKPPEGLSSRKEMRPVVKISEKFDDTVLPTPILTTWEKKDTKLKRPIRWRNETINKCVLVDRASAQVHTGFKKEFPIGLSHNETCAFCPESSVYMHMNEFMQEAFPITQNEFATLSTTDVPSTTELPMLSKEDKSSPAVPSAQRDDRRAGISSNSAHGSTIFSSQRATKTAPEISRLPRQPQDPKLPAYMYDEDATCIDDFCGREDVLSRLDEALLPRTDNRKQLRTYALCGFGGIGKTTIAARFVQTRRKNFDAIFWVRADTPSRLLDGFARIAVNLRLLDDNAAQDRQFSKSKVIEWLKRPVKTFLQVDPLDDQQADYLLIFDNVEDEDLLKTYWPAHGSGSIILTSRDPLAPIWAPENSFSTDHGMPLGTFPTDDAIKFLLRVAPLAKDVENARTVVERLGGLPLALRQMGRIITRRNQTFSSFLETYGDPQSRQRLIQAYKLPEGATYQHTLATVWGLEQLSSGLNLLNVLALLDPDSIQESLLTDKAALESLKGHDYSQSFGEYQECKQQLWQSSLITSEHDDLYLRIHPVVQDVARAKMSEDQFTSAFTVTTLLLLQAWPVKEPRIWHHTVNYWHYTDPLYNHIGRLYTIYLSSEESTKKKLGNQQFVQLLTLWGWYDHERGNSEGCRAVFEAALERCEAGLEGCEALQMEIHKCLGAIATETSDGPSAYHHYQTVMNMQSDSSDALKDPEKGETLAADTNELGIAQLMIGHIEQAKDSLEFSRGITHLHRHSDSMLSIYMLASANLGLAHWLDREYEDASRVLLEAWTKYETHPSTEKSSFRPARLMYALGNVKTSQQLLDEGLAWHEEAFDHFNKTSGENHHRTADVCCRLAEHYCRLERFEEAHRHLEHAIGVYRSKGCYKPELARANRLMGKLLEVQSKDDEAKQFFDTALKLYHDVQENRRKSVSKKALIDDDFDSIITFWSR